MSRRPKKQARITTYVDECVKDDADALADALGLTTSSLLSFTLAEKIRIAKQDGLIRESHGEAST